MANIKGQKPGYLANNIHEWESICMYLGDEIRIIYTDNGEFSHFALEDEMPKIIDYKYMSREIIVLKDNTIELGDIKKKKEIKTIDELLQKLTELVLNVKTVFYESIWDKIAHCCEESSLRQTLNGYFSIKNEDMELLINQLVIDVLLKKYYEADFKEEITLAKYCDKHFYYDYDSREKWIKSINKYDFPINPVVAKDTAHHMMDRQVKRMIRVMNNPEYKEEYAKMGIDLNEDIHRFATTKIRPKIIWDHFFHTGNKKLITSRQYRRNFLIERDTDYYKLAQELNYYDKYVQEVFLERKSGYTDQEYFRKSMDFYILEAQSRFDFMYKLAEILEKEGLSNSYKIRFLIEGFSVNVSCPYIVRDAEDNAHLCFDKQEKAYLPIILIEKSCKRKLHDILKESDSNPFLDDYLIKLYRAIAYELFIYHYTFISDNYKEISDFIRNNYDILSYHEKNKIWEDINSQLTPAQKTRLAGIEIINNYLFPEFSDWSRAGWRNSTKNKTSSETSTSNKKYDKIDETKVKNLKDEEYPLLLGMDKKTFEKILSILEGTFRELHTQGGRPARLSVFDKLIITIEYSRNKRTMKNIAVDFGVSKSRISDAINWVKKTLIENGTISLAEILNG